MTPRIENEARIDVLLELDVLRHTLPILVADAQKATTHKLDAEPVVARLAAARAAITELILAADGLSPWRIGSGNSLDHAALHEAQQRLLAAVAGCRGGA